METEIITINIDINCMNDFDKVWKEGDRLSIIKSKCVSSWLNYGLYIAYKNGHWALTQLIINKGVINWNYYLHKPCTDGHLDLAKLFIIKGVDDWV